MTPDIDKDNDEYSVMPTFGAQFFKCTEEQMREALVRKLFPVDGMELIGTLGGNFTKNTLDDIPKDRVQEFKRQGATHVAIGMGKDLAIRKLP